MDSNGVMQTGWQTIDNKTYYFSETGSGLVGWQTIDGKLYYCYSDGHIAKGIVITRRVGNKLVKYIIDTDGVAREA